VKFWFIKNHFPVGLRANPSARVKMIHIPNDRRHPERTVPAKKISGLIERVTLFNEENRFCVPRVQAKNHREEVTVVGSAPAVNTGEWLAAAGQKLVLLVRMEAYHSRDFQHLTNR
jgi:hypothetical protein